MMTKLEAPEGGGELLRSFRVQKKLTQEMLATLAGVSTQTISNIETKNTNYSVGVLCRLADVLDLGTDILLGRCPEKRRELDLQECARILRENGACIAEWMEQDHAPDWLLWMMKQYQETVEQLLDYLKGIL